MACASLGISFTLSAENSQTASPDRSVMRSICRSKVWLSTFKDVTRSRSGGSPSSWPPSGLRLSAATSKAGSRSRSWSSCCAARGPSLTRWSCGIPRKLRYLAACAKFAERQDWRKESTALCGESRWSGSSAFKGVVAAEGGGGPEPVWAEPAGATNASNALKSTAAKATGRGGKRFRHPVGLAPNFPDRADAKLMTSRGCGRFTTTHEHSGFHRKAGL